MGKHTLNELHQMQAAPLTAKIRMTQRRIRDWVEEYGEDGVYISFSGGKDSFVLLYLARQIYPDLLAVHVNTSLEFPEIEKYVKTFDNVEIIKPKMNFMQTVTKYGYPFFGKEICETVYGARRYLTALAERTTMPSQSIRTPLPEWFRETDLAGIERRLQIQSSPTIDKTEKMPGFTEATEIFGQYQSQKERKQLASGRQRKDNLASKMPYAFEMHRMSNINKKIGGGVNSHRMTGRQGSSGRTESEKSWQPTSIPTYTSKLNTAQCRNRSVCKC